jgi:hypothetical protein
MKRLVLFTLTAVTLLAPALVRAEQPFNPDCKLDAINSSIDSIKEQIKSSPANGHAAGHYKRALGDAEKLRKQLHEGCRAWNKSLKKK